MLRAFFTLRLRNLNHRWIETVPWGGLEGRNMAAEMEDLWTLVTAEQFPSVLAHGTPVLVGVLVGLLRRGLLRLLLLPWGRLLTRRLRLDPRAVR